jgi:hypothetical protein
VCVLQAAPTYSDLEGRFYEELEASAEEAVRDALYGEKEWGLLKRLARMRWGVQNCDRRSGALAVMASTFIARQGKYSKASTALSGMC